MSSSTPGPNRGPSDRSTAGRQDGRGTGNGFLASIKAPLIFSAVLGLIGGGVAMLTASGGTDNPLRVDIGLIAFGVFFIVSLVFVAMLQLASKDNPDHLSQGSGINRSSQELHRAMVAQRKQQAQTGSGTRPEPDVPGQRGQRDQSGRPR